MFGKRGQIVWDKLVIWMVSILVLILVVILFITLSGKGQGALDFLSNLLRFG